MGLSCLGFSFLPFLRSNIVLSSSLLKPPLITMILRRLSRVALQCHRPAWPAFKGACYPGPLTCEYLVCLNSLWSYPPRVRLPWQRKTSFPDFLAGLIFLGLVLPVKTDVKMIFSISWPLPCPSRSPGPLPHPSAGLYFP